MTRRLSCPRFKPLCRAIKICALCAQLLAAVAPEARAYRPYAAQTETKTSWMSVSSRSTGQEDYLAISADGTAIIRSKNRKATITRRGKIKEQLARDFFREIENSPIITSQGGLDSKQILYRDDRLRISAYISGELRRIDAPMKNFGEAFSHAFSEVKKAAGKMPVEKQLKGFLMAELIEGMALEEYRSKAPKETADRVIETSDIQKINPLMKAIKQPYRLIPLENEDEIKDMKAFISVRGLYTDQQFFYLSSTRGTFKCEVLNTFNDRKPAKH